MKFSIWDEVNVDDVDDDDEEGEKSLEVVEEVEVLEAVKSENNVCWLMLLEWMERELEETKVVVVVLQMELIHDENKLNDDDDGDDWYV